MIKQILARNDLLQKRLHTDALMLLVYSRRLLMCPVRRNASRAQTPVKLARTLSDPMERPGGSADVSSGSSVPSSLSSTVFRFHALPIEIQQHVLSHLAPILSPSQRIRIFEYAATPATLKPLLQLPGSNSVHAGCIPDPATLPFSSAAVSLDPTPLSPSSSLPSGVVLGLGLMPSPASKPSFRLDQVSKMARAKSSPCANGQCMGAGGSVFCHRYETRMAWLKEMGCFQFDAAGRDEEDVLQLIATSNPEMATVPNIDTKSS